MHAAVAPAYVLLFRSGYDSLSDRICIGFFSEIHIGDDGFLIYKTSTQYTGCRTYSQIYYQGFQIKKH